MKSIRIVAFLGMVGLATCFTFKNDETDKLTLKELKHLKAQMPEVFGTVEINDYETLLSDMQYRILPDEEKTDKFVKSADGADSKKSEDQPSKVENEEKTDKLVKPADAADAKKPEDQPSKVENEEKSNKKADDKDKKQFIDRTAQRLKKIKELDELRAKIEAIVEEHANLIEALEAKEQETFLSFQKEDNESFSKQEESNQNEDDESTDKTH